MRLAPLAIRHGKLDEAALAAANFAAMLLTLGLLMSGYWTALLWMPLVNSIALAAMLHKSDPARPWPIIASHGASATLGLIAAGVLGTSIAVAAAAAAASVFLMVALRAVHPPAAATAALFTLSPLPLAQGYFPFLAGTALVGGLAVFSRASRRALRRRGACETDDSLSEPKTNI